MMSQNELKQVCPYWKNAARCILGAACTQMHVDQSRAIVCDSWHVTGKCRRNDDCPFSHGTPNGLEGSNALNDLDIKAIARIDIATFADEDLGRVVEVTDREDVASFSWVKGKEATIAVPGKYPFIRVRWRRSLV